VAYVEEDAQTTLEDARDLLDEARDVALARSAVYQQSLHNYHRRRVRGRSFDPATLCFVSSKQAHRSWNHHGKAHISFTKQSLEGHIDYTTPKQGWTSRTHGTPHSCADSILRADIFFPFPSLSVTKRWQQTTLNHCAYGAKQ
jgi:hypothetical protein